MSYGICLSLSDLLHSSMIISKSIHVAAVGFVLFFFMAEYYSFVHLCHFSFIHSSVHGRVGCLHVSAVVNSAAENIGMHVSFCVVVLSGYPSRSGIAGSQATLLLFFEGLHTVFHSGCIH